MAALSLDRQITDLYETVLTFVKTFAQSADAEDIVQEAMMNALKHKDQYNSSKGSLPVWVRSIAYHGFLDFKRKKKRRNEIGLSVLLSSEERIDSEKFHRVSYDPTIEEPTDHSNLVKLVGELPSKHRDVVIRGYFLRQPYTDIARVCRIPLGTVKSRLHAAKQELRLKIAS